MTVIVPLLPCSHFSDCPEKKKIQPRSQGLLRPVVATALFFPEYSLLAPAVRVWGSEWYLCHHPVFGETNSLNLATFVRSERPGESDAGWEEQQHRRRFGYPDQRIPLIRRGLLPPIQPHLTLRPGLPSFPSSPSNPAGPCAREKGVAKCCSSA